VVLCRHAPEGTSEAPQADDQAQLGISRDRLGGVLTSPAGARKRLPRNVDYPIERDRDLRRYRIEPVAAELLLGAVERARAAGLVAGRGSADAYSAGQTGVARSAASRTSPASISTCEVGSWPAGHVHSKASGPGGGRPHNQ
jgi:hypothetical protein